MNIVITRYRKTSETIDSRLTVGMRICDCAENAIIALKAGTYPLNVVKCKQHARKMPVVKVPNVTKFQCSNEPGTLEPSMRNFSKLSFVCNNSTMPQVCQML